LLLNRINYTLTLMNKVTLFLTALLGLTLILVFGPWLNIDNGINAILSILIGALFVTIHGYKTMGLRNIIAFILITYLISFSAEAMGVATGLIFGPYHYSDNLGPKILGVPPMIQVAYIAMGYSSLVIARIILGFLGTNLKNWSSIFGVSLIGAFVMVAWDVMMDPYQSTLGGDWIWPTGGPYFGIGLHNFIGWFTTVFIFMFAYQIYARSYPEKIAQDIMGSKFFWSMPVLYYALMALTMILVPIVGGVTLPYAQPQNYNGTLEQLTQSLTLIGMFVMGTPVAIALVKLILPTSKLNS
jgi:uncharacterized membrane protein